MTAKIFVVDTDVATVRDIRPVLAREGYQVEYAQPGRDALRRILLEHPDLVILGMGQTDEGWQFCRQLVNLVDQPLLLLLASGDEQARVKGLDLGADDCMVKPVPLLELVARVRALLRRKIPSTGWRQDLFLDEELAVDLGRQEVRFDDQLVALTPTEFRLLACFIQRAGQVLSRDLLLAEVWGPRHQQAEGLVKQHVHHLRKKIERDPSRPRHIVTERGMGYRFQVLDVPQPSLTDF